MASGLAVLFPGQGSQHVGMGAELAAAYPAAARLFELADDVLGFSLSRLCWEGPEEELTETQNAQPAILVHSLAAWAVLDAGFRGRVAFAAGHSLGEFTAYAAADSVTFEDAVRLVRRRGELMAGARQGSMSAVVGLEAGRVERICEEVRLQGHTVVAANYNSPQQIVLSGDPQGVELAGERAKEAGAKMVRPLSVSGAFHSPLMADAQAGLAAALEETDFRDPSFPVISNVTAEPVDDAATAKATLLGQLTSPVRWTEGIRRMAAQGVSEFVELGPGKVLTGLLRRIDGDLRGESIGVPADLERRREAARP